VRNKLLKYDMGKKADFKLKFIVIPINLHLWLEHTGQNEPVPSLHAQAALKDVCRVGGHEFQSCGLITVGHWTRSSSFPASIPPSIKWMNHGTYAIGLVGRLNKIAKLQESMWAITMSPKPYLDISIQASPHLFSHY
jgi:hypothetical protein